MKVVYIAIDGKQFDNRNDCTKYEEKRKQDLRDEVKKLKHKIINVQECIDSMACECFYYLAINVETIEQAETVCSFLFEYGITKGFINGEYKMLTPSIFVGHVVFIDGEYDDCVMDLNFQGDRFDKFYLNDYVGTEEDLIRNYVDSINRTCNLIK